MDMKKLDKLIESAMNSAFLQGKHLNADDAAQNQLAVEANKAKDKLVKFINENSGN